MHDSGDSVRALKKNSVSVAEKKSCKATHLPYAMEFTRIEGAAFNPLPQKVPMRYSFSLDQKRILMKHYENGMFGQSLAYQDKIVACAQEAGVDFDIVRNWIGNMRRKRRMEDAQKTNMTDLMMTHDQSAENKRRFLPPTGAFPGSLYLVRQPAGRVPPPRPSSGPIVRPNTPGAHHPLPTSLIKNTPLATRDQNVALPSSGQPSVTQPPGGTPAVFRPVSSKQESDDEKSSCQVASTAHQSTSQPQVPMNVAGVERREQMWSSQQFPDETIPVMRGQGSGQGQSSGLGQEANDNEWRQQQIQNVMNQVQQSVQQLEGLGCECVVATVIPSDGGTYITGTPIAVQYFSEIQKIQAMADYVNPLGPSSIDSDDTQNDAIEETNNTERQRNQLGQGTKSDGIKQTVHDDPAEAKDEDGGNEEGEGKADSVRKDGEVIRAGEEVYIVNKDHFVIGTGTLLPAPHRRIELKNVPLP